MKKTGIFYGSTTGTTEILAKQIATLLDVADADIYDVANAEVASVNAYEVLILGSPTWGLGELQDDWYSFLDKLKKVNLNGKTVALLGCGDSSSYDTTFCDAIGIIYRTAAVPSAEMSIPKDISSVTPKPLSTTDL